MVNKCTLRRLGPPRSRNFTEINRWSVGLLCRETFSSQDGPLSASHTGSVNKCMRGESSKEGPAIRDCLL
eukprot:g1863.t1